MKTEDYTMEHDMVTGIPRKDDLDIAIFQQGKDVRRFWHPKLMVDRMIDECVVVRYRVGK